MLKKRIIPILLLKDGRCVKGVQFSRNFRDTGDPIYAARVYDSQKADELIFLDIGNNKTLLFNTIKQVAEQCFMPLTIGGGISCIQDVKHLFRIGADKVSINTNAVLNPKLITKCAKIFGSQSIVVSIDAKKQDNGKYLVYIKSSKQETNLDAIEWAKTAEKLGAGELLITAIDHEGTMKGYDLELLSKIKNAVNIPIIINGGCGKLHHIKEAFLHCDVSAVGISSMFHFTDQSTIKARSYLNVEGFNVRHEW